MTLSPVALAKFRLSPRGNGQRIPYSYTGERGHLIGRYYAQQITGAQRFIISWHDAHDIPHSIELDYLDAIEWLDATQGNEPPPTPAQPEPEPPKVDKRPSAPTPAGYMSVNEIAEMYHFTSSKVRSDLQQLPDDIKRTQLKRGESNKWLVKVEYVRAMYNTPENRTGCANVTRINLNTWQPARAVEWLAVKNAETRYNVGYHALKHYCYRNRPLLRARKLIYKADGVLYIAEELVEVMWGAKK